MRRASFGLVEDNQWWEKKKQRPLEWFKCEIIHLATVSACYSSAIIDELGSEKDAQEFADALKRQEQIHSKKGAIVAQVQGVRMQIEEVKAQMREKKKDSESAKNPVKQKLLSMENQLVKLERDLKHGESQAENRVQREENSLLNDAIIAGAEFCRSPKLWIRFYNHGNHLRTIAEAFRDWLKDDIQKNFRQELNLEDWNDWSIKLEFPGAKEFDAMLLRLDENSEFHQILKQSSEQSGFFGRIFSSSSWERIYRDSFQTFSGRLADARSVARDIFAKNSGTGEAILKWIAAPVSFREKHWRRLCPILEGDDETGRHSDEVYLLALLLGVQRAAAKKRSQALLDHIIEASKGSFVATKWEEVAKHSVQGGELENGDVCTSSAVMGRLIRS